MRMTSNRLPGRLRMLAVAAVIMTGITSPARAAVTSYWTDLDGASESPPVASPATGLAQVDLDDVAHTMHLYVEFEGLLGLTTASHIHAATAVPGEGNVGVATTTPTFPGFPAGVSSGVYEITLDMANPGSYNPSFMNAHGGTPASAEAFLFQSIAEGTAYLNIHTSMFGGGEIRGFFAPGSVAADAATWGEIKAIFR